MQRTALGAAADAGRSASYPDQRLVSNALLTLTDRSLSGGFGRRLCENVSIV